LESSDAVQDAHLGDLDDEIEELKDRMDNMVGSGGMDSVDVVDNLASTAANKALSANQGRVLDLKISGMETRLDPFVRDIEVVSEASSVKIKKTRRNASTGADTVTEETLPVASAAQHGVMPKEAYSQLESNTTRIGALEGRSTRYAVTIPNNPTQSDLTALYETASGETGEPTIDAVRLVDVSKNQVWTWFISDGLWHGPESDTVLQATNTALGIVKGSTDAGKSFVEADGTMSLNGYDEIIDDITALEADFANAGGNVCYTTSTVWPSDTVSIDHLWNSLPAADLVLRAGEIKIGALVYNQNGAIAVLTGYDAVGDSYSLRLVRKGKEHFLARINSTTVFLSDTYDAYTNIDKSLISDYISGYTNHVKNNYLVVDAKDTLGLIVHEYDIYWSIITLLSSRKVREDLTTLINAKQNKLPADPIYPLRSVMMAPTSLGNDPAYVPESEFKYTLPIASSVGEQVYLGMSRWNLGGVKTQHVFNPLKYYGGLSINTYSPEIYQDGDTIVVRCWDAAPSIRYSKDRGETWQTVTGLPVSQSNFVSYGDGKWIVFPTEGNSEVGAYSTDLEHWTPITVPRYNYPNSAQRYSPTYGNGVWVSSLSRDVKNMISTNGIDWSIGGYMPSLISPEFYEKPIFAAGKFVTSARSSNKPVLSSTNGVDWVQANISTPGFVRYFNGKYIFFSVYGGVFLSDDAEVFTQLDGGYCPNPANVVYKNGAYICLVNDGTNTKHKFMYSYDLKSWKEEKTFYLDGNHVGLLMLDGEVLTTANPKWTWSVSPADIVVDAETGEISLTDNHKAKIMSDVALAPTISDSVNINYRDLHFKIGEPVIGATVYDGSGRLGFITSRNENDITVETYSL
jgi:hypothetical protein